MVHIYRNAVASVISPPTLLILVSGDQTGWCEQFSQEGYNVVHLTYPVPPAATLLDELRDANTRVSELNVAWGIVTYGLAARDAEEIITGNTLSISNLKVCVHFCPDSDSPSGFLVKNTGRGLIPSMFHLGSAQEKLCASLLYSGDQVNLGAPLATHEYPPIKVYTYPLVSHRPPFPFVAQPPVLVKVGQTVVVNPYTRSATNLSLTRTLEITKRYLGPHYDFEKLWEMHTHYEFAERDAMKTMSTMVSTPYVNHIATMIGGVGYEELARFYKYHFTKVTPNDVELIPVSRTVGCDRIVDEMIFKCMHTTELDYFLPGIPPTGKPIEIAMVGIIAFRGDKLFFEHLYWDQASVLVQLGKLDPTDLPVAGIEVAKKVLDPFGMPSNGLLKRWKESEGLPLD